jgi:ribose transport system substrate-binding protein
MSRILESRNGAAPMSRRILLGLAALAVCVGLAACGSSSSSSSSSSAATTSSSSSSSGVAEAEAIVAQYSKTPTSITVTTPIGKPVPSGKSIDFIDCGIPTCTAVGNSIKAAAKALGWTFKSITGSTEPAGAQAAFTTAIQEKPSAVTYTGIARAEINQQLNQLAALKIPVSTCCTTDAIGNGITNVVRQAASSEASGKVASAFVVANSKGKANTLYVDLPVFPIYVPYRKSFESHYKAFCPSCGLSALPMAATAIGKNAPQMIASYLAAHPSINYVFVVNDALSIGLPAALKAAGVTSVKFVGSDSTAANFPTVASGQELATIPASTAVFGWYQIDVLARYFAGVAQVSEAETEVQLWTAANIPKSGLNEVALNPNYQEQFKKLWGKS